MNTSKWAKAFAIDYKGTLCSDDFEVDNDIFIRDCPFPTLNKGWRNQADYEEGDCSVQVSEQGDELQDQPAKENVGK